MLVAEIDGRVQAYTVAWLVGDELQVIDLAVDKFWRRHGLGRLLMDRLINMWCALQGLSGDQLLFNGKQDMCQYSAKLPNTRTG